MNDIVVKLSIDGKEAQVTLDFADKSLRKIKETANRNGDVLQKMFNYATITTAIIGIKEIGQQIYNLSLQGARLQNLKEYFQGSASDLSLLRQATANTVSDGNLLKLSNQASDLGLSLQQQAILFSLAENAGDKYGTSVEEGFLKVLNASEGQSKGLKSLGIQKKQYEQIVNELAKSYGVEIDKLDADTQKQIRLEAIMKASGITIADVTSKLQDNADKIESASVEWENFKDAIGEALGPKTAFIIKNFTEGLQRLFGVMDNIEQLKKGMSGTYSAAYMATLVGTDEKTRQADYDRLTNELRRLNKETADAKITLSKSIHSGEELKAYTDAKNTIKNNRIAYISLDAQRNAIIEYNKQQANKSTPIIADDKSFESSRQNETNDVKKAQQQRADELKYRNMEYIDLEQEKINKLEELKEIEIKITRAGGQADLDALKNKRDLVQGTIKAIEEEQGKQEQAMSRDMDDFRRSNAAKVKYKEEYDQAEKKRTLDLREQWLKRRGFEERYRKELADYEKQTDAENTVNEFERRRQQADIEFEIAKEKYGNLKVLREQHAREIERIDKEELENKISIYGQLVTAAQNAFNQIFSNAQQSASAEVGEWQRKEEKKLDKERKAELEHAKTAKQREKINEDYDRRQEQLDQEAKRKEYERLSSWFALQKALAVAQIAVQMAQAIAKGYGELGPIGGAIAMGVTIAALTAQAAAVAAQKMPGYAQGGRLPRGRAGFIEGWHDELIAPEKNFETIMRNELIPRVVNNMNYDPSLSSEIKKLNQNFETYSRRPINIDAAKTVRTGLARMKKGKLR